MVKKLLKHEFKYYLRILMFVLPIILSVGITFRLVLWYPNDSVYYQILVFLLYSLVMFTMGASMIFTSILGVIRFFKNMYGQEGYLTFTLPVSNKQHLFVKAFTNVVCQLAVASFNMLSIFIILTAIPQHFGWQWLYNIVTSGSLGHIISFSFDIIILMIVSSIMTTGMIYLCISIGQMVNKNRILLSIGIYYGFGVVAEIIYFSFYIVLIIMGMIGLLDPIVSFLENYPITFFHTIIYMLIIAFAALAFLYYSLVIKIMNNKLNLE